MRHMRSRLSADNKPAANKPADSKPAAASTVLALFLLALAAAAHAETRPHYGGVLRIQTQDYVTTLAPDKNPDASSVLAQQIARLVNDASGDSRASTKSGKSNGPFRVVEFVPGKKLTLAANEDY